MSITVKMTRKKKVEEEVKEDKPKRSKKKEVIDHPEFNLLIEDKEYDLDTSILLCSNNGSDNKKTLHHARRTRMKRPILLEIDCEVPSYNIKNFSLTVDEAKDMIEELQKMVDYLEQV